MTPFKASSKNPLSIPITIVLTILKTKRISRTQRVSLPLENFDVLQTPQFKNGFEIIFSSTTRRVHVENWQKQIVKWEARCIIDKESRTSNLCSSLDLVSLHLDHQMVLGISLSNGVCVRMSDPLHHFGRLFVNL